MLEQQKQEIPYSQQLLACRFVNDVLHLWERRKNVFWGFPVERSHRKVVILALSDSELLFKVSKAIELVASIKLFIVLSVATFYLTIVLGRIRTD